MTPFPFKLDDSNGESLTDQLHRQLVALVVSLGVGGKLPPERELAVRLGISRVTVRNAVAKLVECGLVVRNGRAGTVVKMLPGEQTGANENTGSFAVNELAFGLPWLRSDSRRTVRFLCYETLPAQHKFWKEEVERFNRQAHRGHVEIVWNQDILGGAYVEEYLRREKIDIYLYSHAFADRPECIVKAFPDSLVRRVQQLDCRETFKANEPDILNFFIPLHASLPEIHFNEDLARQIGLTDLRSELRRGRYTAAMDQVAKRLPPGVMTGSRIWDQLAYQGLPHPGKIPEFLLPVLEELEILTGRGNTLHSIQQHLLDVVEQFAAGRQFFWNGVPSMLQTVSEVSFDCVKLPFPPFRNHRQLAVTLDVVLFSKCRDEELCADFVDFLMTDDSQRRAMQMKAVMPLQRALQDEFFWSRYGLDGVAAEDYLSNVVVFRNTTQEERTYLQWLIYGVRQELHAFMQGGISAHEIFLTIMNKFNQIKK